MVFWSCQGLSKPSLGVDFSKADSTPDIVHVNEIEALVVVRNDIASQVLSGFEVVFALSFARTTIRPRHHCQSSHRVTKATIMRRVEESRTKSHSARRVDRTKRFYSFGNLVCQTSQHNHSGFSESWIKCAISKKLKQLGGCASREYCRSELSIYMTMFFSYQSVPRHSRLESCLFISDV